MADKCSTLQVRHHCNVNHEENSRLLQNLQLTRSKPCPGVPSYCTGTRNINNTQDRRESGTWDDFKWCKINEDLNQFKIWN